MKMKGLMSLFFVIAIPAFANDCCVSIESTDAMKYDKNEIVVKKSCKEFTVNLSHSGKLPKNVMGHNVVITKESDARAVASDAAVAGPENHYVKPEDTRVIAFTTLFGGGEKTSVTFNVDKLKVGEAYSFFCSFPGHISLMKGTLSVGS